VTEDEALSAAYPASWGGAVEVTHGDRSHRAARAQALGDPELPLSDEVLDEKVTGLLRFGGLTAATAQRLLDASRTLPEDGSVEALAPALD
jgi:hypothetical protein